MSIAMLYPGGQGKKGDDGRTSAETAEVSYRRLAEARQVLRYSGDLACGVRDGVKPLDEAIRQQGAAPGGLPGQPRENPGTAPAVIDGEFSGGLKFLGPKKRFDMRVSAALC